MDLNNSNPVGLSGLEPPTSRLSGVRSNRLSYKPSVVSDARKFLSGWRRRDSNSRPPACKAGALPTELRPHMVNIYLFASFETMGSSGLEPPTSRLSGVRSNQLSYEPIGLRRPSTLPGSCPPSTIDRLGLNRRVRNGNGCVPQAHHHRRCFVCFLFCLKV